MFPARECSGAGFVFGGLPLSVSRPHVTGRPTDSRQALNGGTNVSDDNTAVAGEQHAAEQESVKEFTPIQSQDDLNKIIEARLARERAKFADYPDLKSAAEKLAAIEDRDKSELDRANERAEKAERKAAEVAEKAATRERELLAASVSTTKKVPAKYLKGSTVEELEASADEFLADIQGIAPDRKPGHVPSAGTGDPRPPSASLDTGAERARALLGK